MITFTWLPRAACFAALGLAGCATCKEPRESGPGLTGTIDYETADGVSAAADLAEAVVDFGDESDSVTLGGTMIDEIGRSRPWQIVLHALTPTAGTTDVADHGDACLERQAGAGPQCSRLEGAIDVHQLARDCWVHESGVAICAETIDLTLDATSSWQGTELRIDAAVLREGRWEETACSDE